MQPKSHQSNKHLGSSLCKILETILEIDKEKTQTNGPVDKVLHLINDIEMSMV